MADSNDTQKTEAQLVYQILLQARDVDNKLLWDRVNIMLLIQGLLFAFLGSSMSYLFDKHFPILIIIILFGWVSAIILHLIARGGNYWVTYWEDKLKDIEKDTFGEKQIFRNRDIDDPVRRKEAIKKGYISTRKLILVFTVIFLFFWEFLFIYIFKI